MKIVLITVVFAAAALSAPFPVAAQEASASQEPAARENAPSPGEIVASAKDGEWVAIAAEDLLMMKLAPDRDGNAREVVIQLMPAPFSQGWISNILTLARAKWYDGISVNRVQDNYVVQWGDANGEDAEKAKPLPEGLKVMGEEEYVLPGKQAQKNCGGDDTLSPNCIQFVNQGDPSARQTGFTAGWALAAEEDETFEIEVSGKLEDFPANWSHWPVHCYGMVGVGRNYSPDTGSGAELYTVIGHAPRHLDRNTALVGRIISGMEHLSSLPRGSGALGFYTEEEADKRTPILSVRVASDLPTSEQPRYEYLSTEGPTFAKYAEARAHRRDPFFIQPAGGADICNIPVPIRKAGAE